MLLATPVALAQGFRFSNPNPEQEAERQAEAMKQDRIAYELSTPVQPTQGAFILGTRYRTMRRFCGAAGGVPAACVTVSVAAAILIVPTRGVAVGLAATL